MASYIFKGATAGPGMLPDGTKVTLKLPLSNGNFQIINNVEVRVTPVTVTDSKATAFVESRKDMCGNTLYTKQ